MPSPRLTFRVSAHLAHRARVRAAREGASLSIALRALLSDYAAGRLPSVQIARSLEAIRAELRAAGVNLNQAVRALHSGIYPTDLERVIARHANAVGQLASQLAAYTLPRRPDDAGVDPCPRA